MAGITEVTDYIAENVLHSKLFDIADDTARTKAVNQAKNTLLRYLPQVYADPESIPVEDIAEQVLWLFKIDDSVQRAELGATSISVDGVSIGFAEMDRTVAPAILKAYGVRSTQRRRVGAYNVSLHHTSRTGNPYGGGGRLL